MALYVPLSPTRTPNSLHERIVRVFRPLFKIRLTDIYFRLRMIGQSATVKEEEAIKYLDSLSPIGENPFEKVTVYKSWASACSFLVHLLHSRAQFVVYQASTTVISMVI
jgi:hypothetical protein